MLQCVEFKATYFFVTPEKCLAEHCLLVREGARELVIYASGSNISFVGYQVSPLSCGKGLFWKLSGSQSTNGLPVRNNLEDVSKF